LTERQSKRDEILDAAESMIRLSGYNGFSTRDVAEAVGIKAASVHYYFPAKSDIGCAVTARYTERFMAALGEPSRFEGDVPAALQTYISAFRQSLIDHRQLCLCAVLGAETGGLPEALRVQTRSFFDQNLTWLQCALANDVEAHNDRTNARAALVLASLEGAMILSKSMNDDGIFDRIAAALIAG
jgi:TetR/AcrR family transcriptional regulator, transcriptional repressor for nem operon